MISSLSNALALLLPCLLAVANVASDNCVDADCEFNVQLLQQDFWHGVISADKLAGMIGDHTTAAPSSGCESMCASATDAWSSKCGWKEQCGGCLKCKEVAASGNECDSWCASATELWSEKCEETSCAGCPECSTSTTWHESKTTAAPAFVQAASPLEDMKLKSELVHSEVEVASVPSDFEPPEDQPTIDEMIADLDVDHEGNYTYLRYLETKLTDAVHAQAIVVSKATDTYQNALAVDDTAEGAQESLDDKLDTAERNEDIAQGTHGSLAILIARKKAQLDALENATNEANETLQAVKPKYLAAEAAYQAALKGTDPIQDYTDTQEAEYEEAQASLDAAESAQRAADLAVHNQTMKLQKEIQELNDKNDDLREVQEDLGRPLPPSE